MKYLRSEFKTMSQKIAKMNASVPLVRLLPILAFELRRVKNLNWFLTIPHSQCSHDQSAYFYLELCSLSEFNSMIQQVKFIQDRITLDWWSIRLSQALSLRERKNAA